MCFLAPRWLKWLDIKLSQQRLVLFDFGQPTLLVFIHACKMESRTLIQLEVYIVSAVKVVVVARTHPNMYISAITCKKTSRPKMQHEVSKWSVSNTRITFRSLI